MSPLQKGNSHRQEARIAKILKKKFKDLKTLQNFVEYLRALRFFAVKKVVFQETH